MCFNVFGHCVTVRSSLLAVDSAAETITHPTNTLSHSLLIIEIMVDTGSVAIPNENLTSVKVDFEIVGPVTTMSVMAAVNADMIVPNLNDLEVAVGSTITDEIMSTLGAGHEVVHWTRVGPNRTSAMILLAVDLTVLETVAAGTMIVTDAADLIVLTVIDAAGLTRLK